MGKAIVFAVEEKLSQKVTEEDKEAVITVYDEISSVMVRAILLA